MSQIPKEQRLKRNVILINGHSKSESEKKSDNDLIHYYSNYFKSIAGGVYEDYEIIRLIEPTIGELKVLIQERKPDFVIIVFIGHGATQNGKQLFLTKEDQIIQAGQLVLEVDKQLIIFESCRSITNSLLTIDLSDKIPNYKKGGVFRIPLSKNKARNLYNQELQKCDKGVVICFACSVNEEAWNFYFSYSLIDISHKWHSDIRNWNQTLGIQDLMPAIITVVSKTALEEETQNQTPVVNGVVNFPFAICKF